jgi:hypothetical protein
MRDSLANAQAQPLFKNVAPSGPSPDLDRARVGDHTFADLMRDATRFPSNKELSVEDREQRDALFVATSALMRLDDNAVTEAVNLIRSGAPQATMLRDALWNAGTGYAQQELVKLMSFFKDDSDRRFALIGLGMVKEPTPATVAYLETMLSDAMHGAQARLSLGSTVQYLKDTDPAAADAVVTLLAQRFEGAQDPIEKASYVDALGNTRYNAARPVIDSALTSDYPAIRSAGVLALRHLQGDDVDGVVARVALGDAESTVRDTAISVIASRTPSAPLMHALDTLMRTEPTIMVRRSAVVAGAGLTGVVPEMRETLAWVASNDPEPKMRELAGGYL